MNILIKSMLKMTLDIMVDNCKKYRKLGYGLKSLNCRNSLFNQISSINTFLYKLNHQI